MSADGAGAAGTVTPGPPHRLALVPGEPLTAPAQRAFLDTRAALLPRAGASGHRSLTALYLILAAHGPVPGLVGGRQRLHCGECRPGRPEQPAEYPCRTAQQALWALDAALC